MTVFSPHDRRLLNTDDHRYYWACLYPERPPSRFACFEERCNQCRIAARSHVLHGPPEYADDTDGELFDFAGHATGTASLRHWTNVNPPKGFEEVSV